MILSRHPLRKQEFQRKFKEKSFNNFWQKEKKILKKSTSKRSENGKKTTNKKKN